MDSNTDQVRQFQEIFYFIFKTILAFHSLDLSSNGVIIVKTISVSLHAKEQASFLNGSYWHSNATTALLPPPKKNTFACFINKHVGRTYHHM
jgi:hypothetical protein